MSFEGLEAFLRATVAISLPPNCLIKRLVKFGKVDFSTSKRGVLGLSRGRSKGSFHKNDPKNKVFGKVGKSGF